MKRCFSGDSDADLGAAMSADVWTIMVNNHISMKSKFVIQLLFN